MTLSSPGPFAKVGSEGASRYLCSVIIPALNEEKCLPDCLSSLVESTLARDQFEVVLVDNGSNDKTVAVASSFVGRLNLTILVKPGLTIASLRNAGATAANGQILAFLDADCRATPVWLATAVAILNQGGGLAGGPYTVPESYNWVAQAWSEREKYSFRGDRPYLHGGNLVIRYEDFRALEGFNEKLRTNEDFEFCQRAKSAGFLVRAFPGLGVTHAGTVQSLRKFFAQQRWHGTDVLRVYLSDTRARRNLRPLAFATITLLASVGCIVGGILACFGGSSLVLIGSVFVLVSGPLILSLREAFSALRFGNLLSLACLFLIYGLARACCLVDLGYLRRNSVQNAIVPPGAGRF